MARDGLSIKLEGGVQLDRVLAKMQQRVGTKVVDQSLRKGAGELRKKIKQETPVAKKDTTGFKLDSRNTEKGQLKRSVKSGLRKRAKVDRNTFLAAVWLQDGRGKAKKSDDGFFSHFVINRHSPNAFGYRGGNNFVKRGLNKANGAVRRIIGQQLAQKIADEKQKEINKLR